MKHRRILRTAIFSATILLAAVHHADAAFFTISGATTTAQAGEGGSVTDTGSLTVSGSTAAITITGGGGTLTNLGIVNQTGTGDGVDVQANTGVEIRNAGLVGTGIGTGIIEGARHGITGHATDNTVTFTMFVGNNIGGIIKGDNGSGIKLDLFNAPQTVNIANLGTIIGNGVTGNGDGIHVDGVVDILNIAMGIIRSNNSFSATTPAQSNGIKAGGGIIYNTSTIEGLVATGNTNAVGRGITLEGVGINGTPAPIYANSVITNSGLIRGQNDSAIVVGGAASGFTVIIDNDGGTIKGGGAVNAAIRTGFDNDTITTSGIIDGSSSGKAIEMGAGNNTLNITGGTIIGDISGGVGGTNTLTINRFPDNPFSYGGAISHFNTTTLQRGKFNLSGSTDGSGSITIAGGIFNYSGAGALGNNIIVNGGEFKNNGGNLTGTLTLTSGTVSGSNFEYIPLTIGTGVTLSPGNSPGTLNSGGQTWAGGGSYLWEINRLAADGGTPGTDPGWDFADIAGTLNITATAENKFVIHLDSLNVLTSWNPYNYYTFTLATASGGITGFDPSEFLIDTSAFANLNSLATGAFWVSVDGNNLDLHFSALPEPTTFGFGFALLSVAFGRRRR